VVEVKGVRIFGPLNLPSELSVHASEMYAKNLLNLSALLIEKGEFAPSGRTRSSKGPFS
jgi:NAD(P) transhydrogenase subunit alpha